MATSKKPGGAVRASARKAVQPPEDHRVRTGALRREQTRRKLLAAAMQVFATKGTDAPLIDDFIAAAGVARGTFYNYFNTTQELLDAVTSELSDAILAEIDKVVLQIPDPLHRLAMGCLLYMHIGVDLPNWGGFVLRTGFRNQAVGKLVDVYMPRDMELARERGQLQYPSVQAARDLVFSAVSQATVSVISGRAPRAHLRQVLALALHGIGVPKTQAHQLTQQALPQLTLPALALDLGGRQDPAG
ncbi:MAG: hypothetical protein RIQ38_1620 [Pseudomonadota bacterium]|jgi:AcrR family transcriptional regulator